MSRPKPSVPAPDAVTSRRAVVACLGALPLAGVLASCAKTAPDATHTPSGGASTPSAPAPSTSAGSPSVSTSRVTPSASGTPSPSMSGQPSSGRPTSTPSQTGAGSQVWQDNARVSHLFFHSLVIDAKVAFADRESGRGYLDYMVTKHEFSAMLSQIHANGYVLVSPHQLGKIDRRGRMQPTPLRLPKGKKPLVLSIDDVSYYEYMDGDGFPTRLVVAADGSVQNEYTPPGTKQVKVGAYDVMPVVDEFVKAHPDFAPFGHKGILALTGYNGVLGYRSSPSVYGPGARKPNPNLDADIATATTVAKALKATGWEFASHSWGHINFTEQSLGRIQSDTRRWKADVEPIVGATDLLIYPFGADIARTTKYSGAKYTYLKGQGYDFFFNVDGSTPAWGQWGAEYLREARFNVDGLSMKRSLSGHLGLEPFFNVKSVLDPARPKSIAGS